MIYEWGRIYKDKYHINYRPQLGWLLKKQNALGMHSTTDQVWLSSADSDWLPSDVQ